MWIPTPQLSPEEIKILIIVAIVMVAISLIVLLLTNKEKNDE